MKSRMSVSGISSERISRTLDASDRRAIQIFMAWSYFRRSTSN